MRLLSVIFLTIGPSMAVPSYDDPAAESMPEILDSSDSLVQARDVAPPLPPFLPANFDPVADVRARARPVDGNALMDFGDDSKLMIPGLHCGFRRAESR